MVCGWRFFRTIQEESCFDGYFTCSLVKFPLEDTRRTVDNPLHPHVAFGHKPIVES